MSGDPVYQASPIKHDNDNIPRRRATGEEMEIRARFLIAYARANAPVTVRQLFYAATVASVAGITKDDNGYNKVQQQVLELRRSGRMPFWCIADLTRFWRGVTTYSDVDEALQATAKFYRKALWRDVNHSVEFWLEKDALAGCVQPVTEKYAIPLMVTRGFSSETFAYEAAQNFDAGGKPVYVYHLGDFDRSGQDAADDLERKLKGYARQVPVIFKKLAVQPEDIEQHSLPTRLPKRNTPADKKWPYDFACELDAMPPALLRSYVESVCRTHMPDEDMTALLAAEESERMLLRGLAGMAA